ILQHFWKGVINDYKRTQLKRFAYKIIYYETPGRIPEEHQKSDLCGICRKELLPQLIEHITILTCGHLFHWQCLERISPEPCCPFCSEEQGSTKKRTIDNSDERYEYDDHDNDYYNPLALITDNNNHHNDSDDISAPEIQEGRLNDDGQRAHPAVPVDNNHHENTNNHHEGDEHNHDHNHEGFGSGLGPRLRRRRVRDSSYHPRVAKVIKKIHHRNESTISAGPAEQAETNQIITLDQSNSNTSNSQTRSRRYSSSPPSSREQNMLQGLIRELFTPINEETNGNNDAGEEFEGSIPLTISAGVKQSAI
ncbi:5866_t:CDS:2, partial [Funneliformis caledonium]